MPVLRKRRSILVAIAYVKVHDVKVVSVGHVNATISGLDLSKLYPEFKGTSKSDKKVFRIVGLGTENGKNFLDLELSQHKPIKVQISLSDLRMIQDAWPVPP